MQQRRPMLRSRSWSRFSRSSSRGVLRSARRSAQREAFVENLFRRFEIGEFESDLSETKRLAALSAKLNV